MTPVRACHPPRAALPRAAVFFAAGFFFAAVRGGAATPAPAGSSARFIIAPAILRVASEEVSFIAVVASSVNCLVSAPHHCSGSTTPAAARGSAGAGAAAGADAGSGSGRGSALAFGGAAGAAAAGSVGMRICSDSRKSSICTFIVFSVDKVMRWTSSAWIVAPSMRAFCSSQNCTVRSSSMRFSSSAGSIVGATQEPMPGSAAPAFFTSPCRKSKPGTSFANVDGSVMAVSPQACRS